VLVDLESDGYTFRMVATASGFLYEHLADELGQAIDRGALRAGDRLPSVRRLAQERSVSVSTVLEAYLQLENAGLIEVRPKSGHFVRRRAPLTAEPRTARICQKPSRVTVNDAYAKILEAMRDPELVPFGCATIDQAYLPMAQLNRIVAQLTREMTTLGARYEGAPAYSRCAVKSLAARSSGASRSASTMCAPPSARPKRSCSRCAPSRNPAM
jgi:DNA-binding transcriptional MocR family regulator